MQGLQVERELSWSQQRAFDDAFDRNKKSMVATYFLVAFFGMIGVHRLYLGRNRSGYIMMGIWLVGMITSITVASAYQNSADDIFFDFVAGLTMCSIGIWVLVDLFLIPKMVRDYNAALATQLLKGILTGALV
jgi:TM2 domain-containing membrane protein YozV